MVYFYLILGPDLGNSSSPIQSKDIPEIDHAARYYSFTQFGRVIFGK